MPKYLDTSMYGSYYVPCKILSESVRKYKIEYTDLMTKEKTVASVDKDRVNVAKKKKKSPYIYHKGVLQHCICGARLTKKHTGRDC